MTRREEVEIDCPGCGQRQPMEICQSINVHSDPELRARLFELRLNVFRCENCGHEAGVDTPLLYHDMERRFTVQYFPAEALEDPDAFSAWNPDGTFALDLPDSPLFEGAAYMSHPHVVFELNEMVRYIVFREMLHAREE